MILYVVYDTAARLQENQRVMIRQLIVLRSPATKTPAGKTLGDRGFGDGGIPRKRTATANACRTHLFAANGTNGCMACCLRSFLRDCLI